VAIFHNLDKLNAETKELIVEDADLFLAGTDNYQWFGYEGLCTKDNILIVSGPGKRSTDGLQAVGAVYGFNYLTKEQVFVIQGNEA